MGKVGVVVGRWQVADLHDGHLDVIKFAQKENDRIFLVIGNSQWPNTQRDPLPYSAREKMLRKHFPHAEFAFLRNEETDELWSKKLDAIIRDRFPTDSPTLYGGRDSFIPHYKGNSPVKEITSFNETSGTELRLGNAFTVLDTSDFRSGLIYAAYNRFTTVMPTADIAVLKNSDDLDKCEILLGKKHGSNHWRLPGGFIDASDNSAEAAAKRELREEAGNIEVSNWKIVGTAKMEKDWRCIENVDCHILTTLFRCEYVFGSAKGDDDLETVKWFSLKDVMKNVESLIVTEHHVLIDLLKGDLKICNLENAN